MKLRAPAVPLITSDPYFSVWSMNDTLNEGDTRHWTGEPHRLRGVAVIDGIPYCFMGKPDGCAAMEQTSLTINALSSKYQFSAGGASLSVIFTAPLLPDDLKLLASPISYIRTEVSSLDGQEHKVTVQLTVDDELCLNYKYEFPTRYGQVELPDLTCARVGSVIQKPLNKCGDNLRVNWGYLYVATDAVSSEVGPVPGENEYGTPSNDIRITADIGTGSNHSALFVIAYDDINSIEYFGKALDGYWRTDGTTIETLIQKAFSEYDAAFSRCEAFSEQLYADAVRSGSEKYAELLSLAYRQSVAGHKLCAGEEGEVLFISKENFSNGCAATVDVTYPSIPLFLLYNPELVKGMLRPIFRYAGSETWFYDFAPHDAGTYPLVNGQVYSHGTCAQWQMPVEECGNMLITTAAAAVAENSIDFAKEHWDLLETWCGYLQKEGLDPKNQLCTDDFAGHLAHNCNLSLKAIMGVAAFGILCRMAGLADRADEMLRSAKSMAEEWLQKAANGDGTFRLAFDRENTFSMKYNVIWDQLFGTQIFPKDAFLREIESYVNLHNNRYGLLLDNRAGYTKSDWLVWSAALSDKKEDFTALTDRLWDAYNESESRVPMTDWYDTLTAKQVGFQNRTVQGGLFIKLLKDKEICKCSRIGLS